MSGIERKVKRNQLKKAFEKQGMKRIQHLSKYRFKTQDEMLEEQSNRIVEEMAKSVMRKPSK